jgi:hypothetical protein
LFSTARIRPVSGKVSEPAEPATKTNLACQNHLLTTVISIGESKPRLYSGKLLSSQEFAYEKIFPRSTSIYHHHLVGWR